MPLAYLRLSSVTKQKGDRSVEPDRTGPVKYEFQKLRIPEQRIPELRIPEVTDSRKRIHEQQIPEFGFQKLRIPETTESRNYGLQNFRIPGIKF